MRKVRLRRDWRKIVKHAWSVKLLGISFLFTGAEAALPHLQLVWPGMPAGVFLVFSAVFTGAAFVARLLAQAQFGENE